MSVGGMSITEVEKPIALVQPKTVSVEDPLSLFSAIFTKVRTIWMRFTYPFARFGKGVSIHYSCDVRRSAANRIAVGNSVYMAPQTWLNIPEPSIATQPAIVIEDGCKIGRRCMISAKNLVRLDQDVLLGPTVLITDHSHRFSDPNAPVHEQGLTTGGTVRIERNCWVGYGAVVVCTSGDLVIGRNSVVGANTVVTTNVPPFSVVVGSPAKIVRRYDPRLKEWVKAECI